MRCVLVTIETAQEVQVIPAIRLFVGATVAGAALLVATAGRAQPSFNCATAGGQTERTICSNGALAALDVRMVELFNQARQRNTALTIETQRMWLRTRDACAANAQCIQSRYDVRIQDLTQFLALTGFMPNALNWPQVPAERLPNGLPRGAQNTQAPSIATPGTPAPSIATQPIPPGGAPAFMPPTQQPMPTQNSSGGGNERTIAQVANLTASTGASFDCRPNVTVTLRSPDGASFVGNKDQVRSIIPAIIATLSRQCPAARTLHLNGYVGGRFVYRGAVGDIRRRPDFLTDQFLARDFQQAVRSVPQVGSAPNMPQSGSTGSLFAAQSIGEQCQIVHQWAARLQTEYPDLHLRSARSSEIIAQSANLFRDEFFVPVFGRPYDELVADEAGHRMLSAIGHRVLNKCTDADKRSYPGLGRLFEFAAHRQGIKPFWSEQLAAAMKARRDARKALDGAVAMLNQESLDARPFASLLTLVNNSTGEIKLLWPSEQRNFQNYFNARLQSVATRYSQTRLAQITAETRPDQALKMIHESLDGSDNVFLQYLADDTGKATRDKLAALRHEAGNKYFSALVLDARRLPPSPQSIVESVKLTQAGAATLELMDAAEQAQLASAMKELRATMFKEVLRQDLSQDVPRDVSGVKKLTALEGARAEVLQGVSEEEKRGYFAELRQKREALALELLSPLLVGAAQGQTEFERIASLKSFEKRNQELFAAVADAKRTSIRSQIESLSGKLLHKAISTDLLRLSKFPGGLQGLRDSATWIAAFEKAYADYPGKEVDSAKARFRRDRGERLSRAVDEYRATIKTVADDAARRKLLDSYLSWEGDRRLPQSLEYYFPEDTFKAGASSKSAREIAELFSYMKAEDPPCTEQVGRQQSAVTAYQNKLSAYDKSQFELASVGAKEAATLDFFGGVVGKENKETCAGWEGRLQKALSEQKTGLWSSLGTMFNWRSGATSR
jgi:uncharacterized protein